MATFIGNVQRDLREAQRARGAAPSAAGSQSNGFKKSPNASDHTVMNPTLAEVKAFLINEENLHLFDDLTKVNPVTTATVLKCLQARYVASVFYTNAGCTLVALNPFQPVSNLYCPDIMKVYHSASRPQELKPHIFTVAEEAFRNVQSHIEPVNQSLIVSGESGAGKTWTSRCLMNYFATVATSPTSVNCRKNVEKIEKRVLDSNPVMEAFGNACTLRNHNSSRFGKYIQLQLNRSQQLEGASVQTYLLEKTRVAYQAPLERNFHIFYQVMKGATEEQRLEWGFSEEEEFFWLPNADKILEEDQFEETKDAMLHLGIDSCIQNQVFRILAGLLHLGNVRFSSPTDESHPCDLKEKAKYFLKRTAYLLKVSEDSLLEELRVRTITAGRQQQVFKKPCSKIECGMRRDCVAKVIYAKLFDWLVKIINCSICSDSSRWTNFIGLLDVYGFESFPQNNLEQLCINYANEKLQQHFVAHYLKAQQEEYSAEDLEWSFVSYQDNQSCLELIEGNPTSIFSLLNEESRLNRLSDANQFRTRLQAALASNHCLSWNVFSKVPNFVVAHYAGKVNYQIEGMMEKNKDPVPPELMQLLEKSEDTLLKELFPVGEKEHNDSKAQNKAVTVVSKFKSSLENLMSLLNSTTPHYIRCIKPNMDCKPLLFKSEEILSQLEACGIVETIHLSAAGFPIRVPFQHFVERYGLLKTDWKLNLKTAARFNGCCPAKKRKGSSSDGSTEALSFTVQDILTNVLGGQSITSSFKPTENRSRSSLVHCGKTKVFMTHSMLEMLESARSQTLSKKVLCIQYNWRRYCQRKLARSRRAATIIQAAIRSWLTRRWIKKLHQAAVVLQRAWKTWKIKMDFLAAKELDDTTDFKEMALVRESPVCSPLYRSVYESPNKLSQATQFRDLKLHAWPLGLMLSSVCITGMTPSISETLKAFTRLAAFKVKWRSNYKVEHHQSDQGIASIRALPEVQVKFHCRRSPLLFADIYPEHTHCTIIGLNQILLEKKED
ncbi:unconventional myosin-XIX isoform X1 [Stegostoma tigrinum]|uniref:unconventional myosin-XIX isoform X1 n=2 Tax=Stegostoma tigrinum TaxID=3053191 RepID=UPI00202ADB57|nr:unconventional myosin-XIX isoform X1 [Stegostoma tigrinum]